MVLISPLLASYARLVDLARKCYILLSPLFLFNRRLRTCRWEFISSYCSRLGGPRPCGSNDTRTRKGKRCTRRIGDCFRGSNRKLLASFSRISLLVHEEATSPFAKKDGKSIISLSLFHSITIFHYASQCFMYHRSPSDDPVIRKFLFHSK